MNDEIEVPASPFILKKIEKILNGVKNKGPALSVTLFLVTMILVSIQRKYIKEDIDR